MKHRLNLVLAGTGGSPGSCSTALAPLMALIRAEVQTIQDYWERVKNIPGQFLEEKRWERVRGHLWSEAGKGSGPFPLLGRRFLLLGREICPWRGGFATGEEILPIFYPKSTFPKKAGKPDGSSRGMKAVEGETPPRAIIRPLIN